MTTVRSLF